MVNKVIIEFASEEAESDARTALDGAKWKMAMWELDQKLRSTTKYGTSLSNSSQKATSEEVDVADAIRESIRDILNSYNLTLAD